MSKEEPMPSSEQASNNPQPGNMTGQSHTGENGTDLHGSNMIEHSNT